MKAWIRKVLAEHGKLAREFTHDIKVVQAETVEMERRKRERQKRAEEQARGGRGIRRDITKDGRMLCRTCKELIPLTEFYIHRRKDPPHYSNYDSDCNPCRKSKMVGRLRGITAQEHQQLVREAAGKCQICEGTLAKPNIDHCHATGKIRGVLCTGCNAGIGGLRDSPDLLRKAAAYLERFQEESGGSLGTHSERG